MERGAIHAVGGAEASSGQSCNHPGRRAAGPKKSHFQRCLLWRDRWVLPCEAVTWLVAFLSK